ncbi:amino acid permease [Actinoplanes cyaneus]|uniref:Amino acid permease n=1 Tax=Actinoplanes cyaneus TaxID=52696 RepID=A0A919M8I1_9ACTN|nr:APC family permease [Actinoplanes cyaneus]MCW2141972.1 Amino acid transporter [Actinoplanes cyaneus]GID68423.1 amino acid permease [Actinoplanes cyaneus]
MATLDEPPHAEPAGLAHGRLGAGNAAFLGAAAATPIATVVLVIPPVLAAGAGPLAALAVAAVAVVLFLFGTPYAAMIRRMPSAGAAYPQVARGLGRPAALTAAWLALAGYHAIQLGLYSLAGQAAAPLLHGWLGVAVPWWAVAAGCWAVVALAGTLRVEFAAAVIAVLAVAEAAVLTGLAGAFVVRPAGGRIATSTFLPGDLSAIDRPLLGLLLAVVVLAFAGFETTAVCSEEGRDPHRTAGRAARIAILLLTVLLAGVTWSMIVAAGPRGVAGRAAARGPELIFALADDRLAPWAVTIGRVVLVTGLLAGILAVHHVLARYLFALGRERVLPAVLGNVSHRTRAPRAASLTQSLVAGASLLGAVLAGGGASVRTARWLTVGGSLAVLVLLLLTAVAALLHLNRVPGRENLWSRFLAPVLSTVSLGALLYLALLNLPELLGVPSGSPWVLVVSGGLGGCLVAGCVHALVLRSARPVRYAGIGLGGAALVITPSRPRPDADARNSADPWPWNTPAVTPDAPVSGGSDSGRLAKVPRQRTPGAHRPERVHPEVNG